MYGNNQNNHGHVRSDEGDIGLFRGLVRPASQWETARELGEITEVTAKGWHTKVRNEKSSVLYCVGIGKARESTLNT